MIRSRTVRAIFLAGLFAPAALVCLPQGIKALSLLMIADEPAAISDRALARVFTETAASREIEAALKANDTDLAKSFLDLAQDRGVRVSPELAQRAAVVIAHDNSAVGHAERFVRGLLTGEPDDAVGFFGTALGDLFVFGDIRDALRESGRYVSGEHVDELVLVLACVGIAVTAGTYATVGAAAPVRVGLSTVKAAHKSGRIGTPMAAWIGRSLRNAIDWDALRRARAPLLRPVAALRAAREVVKVDKVDELVRFVGEVGRVQRQAGTHAALDGLKLAQRPGDMSRIAKLAEKKGSRTRAVLKTLGSGAIFLSIASANLAFWVLGAIVSALGLVSAIKSAVERATLRHLQRKRQRRHERHAAMMASRA
jgi:hypothetical protein